MPSIKRTGVKAKEVKTGFEAYDGPTPTARGMFRGVIKAIKIINSNSSDRQGLQVTIEAEAAKNDVKNHKQYDGYPMFGRLWFGDEDALVQRENNFYHAINAGDDPNIVYDEQTGKVSKLGKINPVGKVVTVDLRPSTDEKYKGSMEVDGIYKTKESAAAAAEPEEEPEDETEVEEDGEFEEREEELNGTGLPALRKIAKELDIKTTGLKKDALVEAILDAEFPEDGAAALEEDEEEEEDEDEAEVEDDSEEEEDDEAEEDEEEEEDEDDGSEERRTELKGLTRVQLKKILQSEDHSPDFKVLKRHSDEDLVEAIIDVEFGEETPF